MSRLEASAPGRVNLIGEHTDYNGGMVLPAALSVGLNLALSPRTDGQVIIESDTHGEIAKRRIEESATGHWSDPCVGALQRARGFGWIDGGASLKIKSSIPAGSGLSSSAALIVAILKAAREAGKGEQSDIGVAVAARQVENEYMGVPCGIMDQMAVALATPGTAMALNTKTLDFRLVNLPQTHTIAVIHSGVFRKLTEGRYAERKVECDAAKEFFATADLCLLDPQEIASSTLPDPYRKRAMHCATEHRRVLTALEALKTNDIAALGTAMNESHVSMRDYFEMSVPQIDELVSNAQKLGANGARLTGGGFGGCIVAMVDKSRFEDWLSNLLATHRQAKLIDTVVGS